MHKQKEKDDKDAAAQGVMLTANRVKTSIGLQAMASAAGDKDTEALDMPRARASHTVDTDTQGQSRMPPLDRSAVRAPVPQLDCRRHAAEPAEEYGDPEHP